MDSRRRRHRLSPPIRTDTDETHRRQPIIAAHNHQPIPMPIHPITGLGPIHQASPHQRRIAEPLRPQVVDQTRPPIRRIPHIPRRISLQHITRAATPQKLNRPPTRCPQQLTTKEAGSRHIRRQQPPPLLTRHNKPRLTHRHLHDDPSENSHPRTSPRRPRTRTRKPRPRTPVPSLQDCRPLGRLGLVIDRDVARPPDRPTRTDFSGGREIVAPHRQPTRLSQVLACRIDRIVNHADQPCNRPPRQTSQTGTRSVGALPIGGLQLAVPSIHSTTLTAKPLSLNRDLQFQDQTHHQLRPGEIPGCGSYCRVPISRWCDQVSSRTALTRSDLLRGRAFGPSLCRPTPASEDVSRPRSSTI